MKISVIIPVHNVGTALLTCLDSIYAQDFPKSDYEVLVVFDSCTDNSESIVLSWQKEHNDMRMRAFRKHCGSAGGARNVGLDNACGEFILFVDGDDYLMNNSAMTILYNAAQGHNAVRMLDHGLGGGTIKFSKRLTIWLHFFSREFIGNDRFTDLMLSEDFEFVKRIRSKPGYNEATVNIPLYFYNYDRERMIERIKKAHNISRERAKQGLPPVFVCDEFIPDELDESVKARIRQSADWAKDK